MTLWREILQSACTEIMKHHQTPSRIRGKMLTRCVCVLLSHFTVDPKYMYTAIAAGTWLVLKVTAMDEEIGESLSALYMANVFNHYQDTETITVENLLWYERLMLPQIDSVSQCEFSTSGYMREAISTVLRQVRLDKKAPKKTHRLRKRGL
jgi:hypothetical protein